MLQFTTSVSFGYFLYDMFDYSTRLRHVYDIRKRPVELKACQPRVLYMYTFGFIESVDITVHHIVILALFWPSCFAYSMCGLAALGLIIEFNNVFLHERRLLLWLGYTKNSVEYSALDFRICLSKICRRLVKSRFSRYV